MLMTVMLLAGRIQFFNMGARAAEETVPEVIISGVKVTENGEATGALTGYLEVSVHVHAKGFQTVGAVLSYDKTVLTPVDWSTATAIRIPRKKSMEGMSTREITFGIRCSRAFSSDFEL